MKGKIFNILLIFILVAGLSLMLYPTISDAYNSYLQSQIIVEYSEQVNEMEEEAFRKEMEAARAYNKALTERSDGFHLTEELETEYWQRLNTTSGDIMAYLEIPSIAVTLPIAHGTDEKTLAKSVGHISWSSLPVGGAGTHCVVSGHRGLPSAELFTNVDRMEVGDRFRIHVLGQTLDYRVFNIAVVEPYDYSLLRILEDEDLCTLVTCTPYGINSHRLLIQGIRINADDSLDPDDLTIWNEIRGVDMMVVVPVALAVVIVAAFLVVLFLDDRRRKGKGGGCK